MCLSAQLLTPKQKSQTFPARYEEESVPFRGRVDMAAKMAACRVFVCMRSRSVPALSTTKSTTTSNNGTTPQPDLPRFVSLSEEERQPGDETHALRHVPSTCFKVAGN